MPKKRNDRTGTVISTSGITSLSPRVFLRETDNMSGSYPTIARISSDRSGIYSSSFDDTTAVFTGPSNNLILGRQILSSSQYADRFIATPSTNPTLTGPGTASFGIADQRITFTPGQDVLPFKEENLFETNPGSDADPFYLVGTNPDDIGLGFSSPLRSKTKIEIDINPAEETKVFFSTGTLAGTVNSGLAYYNFDLNRFEVHGNLTSGSNVDFFNPDPVMRSGSMLAFAPSFPSSNALIQRNAGFPTTLSGFPFDKKFNATGSQLFKASNIISSPFLVEKMVYEFSGSMPFLITGEDRANVMQFFILNQRGYNISERNVRTSWRNTRNFISAYGGSTVTGSFFVNNIKDIVNVAQVSLYNSTAATAGIDQLGIARDLNIEFDNIATAPTGTFVLSSSIKTPAINTGLGFLAARTIGNANGVCLLKNEFGGRTSLANHPLGFLESPRSYINNVSRRTLSGTFESASFDYITAELSEENDLVSPYLLFPSDNLIFGWANQQQPTHNSANTSEVRIAGEGTFEDGRFNILPGKGKLVLYGSLIRENREFHQGTNQLLTSDAIHEDVRDNTSFSSNTDCLDQFLSVYSSQYSGTYIDQVFDEDLGTGAVRIDTSPNSVIAGQAGTTGSLLRGVHLIDASERFYDSLVPDIQSIFTIDGAAVTADPLGSGKAILGFGTVTASSDSNSNNDKWFFSFPFENKYEKVPRIPGAIEKISGGPLDALSVGIVFTGFTPGQKGNAYWTSDSFAFGQEKAKERNKIIFGIGAGPSGSVEPTHIENSTVALPNVEFSAPPILRGFKYGLINAVPQFTKSVFRYDRFGQFRDMLEQRLFAKFQSAGDQSREVVSINFSKVFNVGDGKLVRRQISPEDSTGFLNIDPHSRSTRPFFDVDPGSITQNTDDDSLQVANINSLAGGTDIDPKNLGINDFSSFVKG